MALLPNMSELRPEAGLDEAGRGALAGPVVAAAVILPEDFRHPVLNDSKQLTAAQRAAVRDDILERAVAWGLGIQSVAAIDEHNILGAAMRAMHEALDMLRRQAEPAALVVDGSYFIPYPGIPHTTAVKGDGRFMHVAAASVVAKVFRDELMQAFLDPECPAYGWAGNKGYPTKAHKAAVGELGRSRWHRASFKCEPAPAPADLFQPGAE
jgi:ribonuclease HII